MTDQQQPSADWEPVAMATENPCVVVPEGFQGNEAEAIGLATAGAVQAIINERDSAQSLLETTLGHLRDLVAAYPQTSFAASESAREAAVAWLAWFDGDQPAQQT